jgi:hypothetical protein
MGKKTAYLRLRVDPELKRKLEEILKSSDYEDLSKLVTTVLEDFAKKAHGKIVSKELRLLKKKKKSI